MATMYFLEKIYMLVLLRKSSNENQINMFLTYPRKAAASYCSKGDGITKGVAKVRWDAEIFTIYWGEEGAKY